MCVPYHTLLAISGTREICLGKSLLQLLLATSVVKQSKKHPLNTGKPSIALLLAFLPKSADHKDMPSVHNITLDVTLFCDEANITVQSKALVLQIFTHAFIIYFFNVFCFLTVPSKAFVQTINFSPHVHNMNFHKQKK